MGQTLSRRIAGVLERGMQRHRKEMEKEAIQAIKEREKAGIPFADSTGFQRGTGNLQPRKEIEQEAFLEGHQKNNDGEMPKDLIQFLNDVGPLERIVDKELTSPRLRDEKEEDLLQPPAETRRQRHRERRSMPLVDSIQQQDADDMDESMMTTRTTNFSRTKLHSDDEDERGLSDRDLFRLLLSKKNQGDDSVQKALLEKFSAMSEKDKDYCSNLLMQSTRFLQIPVLMKDRDNSFVGVWPERVEDLTRQKLTTVPESRVQLILALQVHEEQQEKKRGKSRQSNLSEAIANESSSK